MDLFSIAASTIAVVQITAATLKLCSDYAHNVKDSSKAIPKIVEELSELQTLLESLVKLAKDAERSTSKSSLQHPELARICQGDGNILAKCKQELEILREKLEPPSWVSQAGSKRRALFQAVVTWPLRESDTKRTLESIERFKSSIGIALASDQTYEA